MLYISEAIQSASSSVDIAVFEFYNIEEIYGMKKRFSLLFVLLWGAALFSQSVKDLKLDDFRLTAKATAPLATKLRATSCALNNTEVELYVLGWSKNARLAFFENRFIDGRGGFDLIFTILDLIEDKMICYKNFSAYDEKGLSLKECLAKNACFIDRELKKYGIVIAAPVFCELPAYSTTDNEPVNFSVTVKDDTIGEYGLRQMSYDIVAVKNKKQKTVAQVSDEICDAAMPTGYLKSPYENRIALLLAYSQYVFEGSEIFLRFYGCHLDGGFSSSQ